MKIKLKSNIYLGGPFEEGVLELGSEKPTLRDALSEISKRCSMDLIDSRNRDINPRLFTVCIDGREYWLFPDGLDTELSDDVEVKVDMMILGGG